MSANTCGDCRHFKSCGDNLGRCHAHPPVVIPKLIDPNSKLDFADVIYYATCHPVVGVEEHACGEFQPAEGGQS